MFQFARQSVIDRSWPVIIEQLRQHYLAVIVQAEQDKAEVIGVA